MFNKSYSNFVKASSPERCTSVTQNSTPRISGEEARKIYLEELKNVRGSITTKIAKQLCSSTENKVVKEEQEVPLSNQELFIVVQNNDVDTLKCILDKYPNKINVVDDYGWSLLMIACQANSVDAVKLLLKKGIDISVRDKGGNSARSLVVKNKNYILADVLLRYIQKQRPTTVKKTKINIKSIEEYKCEICNKTFPDREEHLSSTLHNISASRGKKIPANYVLPESNRGYQLMLKGGWDKQSGLGRNGSGKLYPVKTVPKKDRKGLGHKKQICEDKSKEDNIKHKNRKKFARDRHSDKSFEINFRREFY